MILQFIRILRLSYQILLFLSIINAITRKKATAHHLALSICSTFILDCATKHANPRDKAIPSELRFIKFDQYELCAEKCLD